MAKLPRTPTEALPSLERRDVATLEPGSVLWRVYLTAGLRPSDWRSFRSFGPVPGGRFDHHPLPAGDHAPLGILYAASDLGDGAAILTCCAEAFQRTRLLDRLDGAPYLAAFALEGPLDLLLTGEGWPTRAGASQAVNSGPRRSAQAWSRAIHARYPELHGVIYPSSMWGPGRNVALYERAAGSLPSRPLLNLPISHPGLDLPLAHATHWMGYVLR